MSSAARADAPPGPVEPKRERGRRRVQAILDVAVTVLAEKGYEATTMSEVAVRSGTAIGSLYRFFPTKAALAEALSRRYVAAIGSRLDAIGAAAMTPAALADALIGVMQGLQRDRAAVAALLDVAGDSEARRSVLREDLLRRLEAVLQDHAGDGRRDVATAASVTLHLMRGVSRLEGVRDEAAYFAALRRALSLHLADALGALT